MIIKLKRVTYSDSEKKKGMGLGTKLALGTAGIAASIGAAKTGMLGAKIMKSTNKAWGAMGKKLGSEQMIMSGSQGYGKAVTKEALSKGATKQVANRMGDKAGSAMLGKLI